MHQVKHAAIVAVVFFCTVVGCGDSSQEDAGGTKRVSSQLAVHDPSCPPGTGRPVTCENEAEHRAEAVSGDPQNPCPHAGFVYRVHAECCPVEALEDSLGYSMRVLGGGPVACTPILDW